MRKIIQIAVAGVENTSTTQCNFVTVALCDDGSVFELKDAMGASWVKYPPIPQPAKEE
jgi:hypothetical protein